MNHFIDVVLPIPVNQVFTYGINEAEYSFIKPGMRVAVPFGKKKIYTSIVNSVHTNLPVNYEVKSIYQIIDEKPLINEIQLKFWVWISKYYMCSIGEVLRAAIPSILLLESETLISVRDDLSINFEELNDEEFLIMEALEAQSPLRINEISDILNKKNIFTHLDSLSIKNLISINEKLYSRYKPKLSRCVNLLDSFFNDDQIKELKKKLKRSPKQLEVLISFLNSSDNNDLIEISDLKNISNSSSAIIKKMINRGIFHESYIQVDRIQSNQKSSNKKSNLSNNQNLAYNQIKESFRKNNIVLFNGVTSSGKTEVYIKIIQSILNGSNQILYLVPEIALTTQLVNRLSEVFSEELIVYHSRFSIDQRVEIWNKVLNSKKPQLIIGARSSLLLPFSNLKLIIVDEEHEQSYKQHEPSPRYHARDSSIVLSKYFSANVLLGSATPSIESYYNAVVLKKYDLVSLNKRYNNVPLPIIELINIREKHKQGKMVGIFSDELLEKISKTINEKKQVILFQNRRGFSPIIECNKCGYTPRCVNCDVSLTYHYNNKSLRCHYCGYNIDLIYSCPSCSNKDVISKGFGTQQVELEISELFPNYRVKRLDYDTTRGKNSFNNIISSFEKNEFDILIGTQMVTKGLDFKNVKLVGVLNVDNSLNFPDFRAYERCYQLIQQVAGRSGRSLERGEVLIQTYDSSNDIFNQIITNDYESMFNSQIEERERFKYPPFFKLVKITLKHKNFALVNESANWLAKNLSAVLKANVLGPEFPNINRVRNKYQKNILIKIPSNQSLTATKNFIKKSKDKLHSISSYNSVNVILNVDNY
ncbi:MAG: primosomal protein N' [Flavobacteriaceae bacterium]|jgi:primosomal protein N' (replication factor Y) (superfamily II helicase)|nr:primosomal protein N' [Flavobacteriaceae bacterium]MBT4113289.1 primosomal protein N' [Flavobacteriaceae bacterium]MBT4614696.1 primosomal protein N' [Flavobacteriaceae bacterium]MBT5247106.1 primosomal protein N' [Flavobacteriaceae bacterium]MBT5649762.1 primosomal protein N' [Flavobacteriaceae bacterium]